MNTEIFLGETTREKTPQNFLNIELNQDSVKPQDNSSLSLQCTSSLSNELASAWVKCIQNEGGASLFIFDSSLDLKPNWANLSNW